MHFLLREIQTYTNLNDEKSIVSILTQHIDILDRFFSSFLETYQSQKFKKSLTLLQHLISPLLLNVETFTNYDPDGVHLTQLARG